jgi:hypothetical protein
MFTRTKLDRLESETIFVTGLDFDDENGLYLWNSGELLR